MPSLLCVGNKLSDHFAAMVTYNFVCLLPSGKVKGEWDWLIPLNSSL